MKKVNMFRRKKCFKGLKVLFLGIIFFPAFSLAQTGKYYTLNQLVHFAYDRYPYVNQLQLNMKQKKELIDVVDTKWLPQISASAKSIYQSEVSALSIPENIEKNFGINIEEGTKLQYQGEMSLSQLIYDGGRGNAQKKINALNEDIQSYQIRLSMLQIQNIIDDLFESILINKEQIKIVQFQQSDLGMREKDILFAIKNGISLKTDMQEIEADIFQLKQRETELRMLLCQNFVQLSSYTQENIDTTAVLELPKFIDVVDKNYTERPDYQMFGLQVRNVDWKLKQINREMIPQVSFFANGYYGRPGLNAMDYSSHYSGIVGLTLKWNIDALYNNIHQKRLVNVDRSIVRSRQILYEIDMNKQISNLNIDIIKNKKLIESDDNIVLIRTSVKNIAAVQLKNGSITLTDYLIKLNDESQAMVNKSIHRIEYLMSGVKMKTLLNKDI